MRIDIDSCEEILITITRNKTRSLLTAFGVFWGIFMLVALIGGGQGMQQAMSSQFEGFATNSAFLAVSYTHLPIYNKKGLTLVENQTFFVSE